MGKDTNIMQKIYQLSWFSDKNDFRKYKNICISVCVYGRRQIFFSLFELKKSDS